MNLPEYNEERIKRLIEIFVMIAGGLLMSIVILFFMSMTYYMQSPFVLGLLILIACSIPACFDILAQRGYRILWIEEIMIPISALICILYSFEVAKDITTRNHILKIVILIHGVTLILNYLRVYFLRKGMK